MTLYLLQDIRQKSNGSWDDTPIGIYDSLELAKDKFAEYYNSSTLIEWLHSKKTLFALDEYSDKIGSITEFKLNEKRLNK